MGDTEIDRLVWGGRIPIAFTLAPGERAALPSAPNVAHASSSSSTPIATDAQDVHYVRSAQCLLRGKYK